MPRGVSRKVEAGLGVWSGLSRTIHEGQALETRSLGDAAGIGRERV